MPGALAGIRVLEFSQIVAGPLVGVLLSDMGADVVKVEPPEGEARRNSAAVVPNEGKYFQSLNRGKRSLTVDLAARARRLSAARRVFSTAGAPAHDCEEMLITQGGRIEMLRAAGPAPQRLGLMLMLDRRLANVPLVRFKALQAEKQLH